MRRVLCQVDLQRSCEVGITLLCSQGESLLFDFDRLSEAAFFGVGRG